VAEERRRIHPLVWIGVTVVVLAIIGIFGVFVYLAMR
jgi:hypothetical protein